MKIQLCNMSVSYVYVANLVQKTFLKMLYYSQHASVGECWMKFPLLLGA